MSFFSKLRGTIENFFQLGIQGPQFKNNAGIIEARNNVDSDFATLRAFPILQVQEVEITANTTTASGVFVTLLTLNVTKLSATSSLLVIAQMSPSNSSILGQSVIARITIDGTPAQGFNNVVGTLAANTAQAGGCIAKVSGLAVGVRTVLLQWRTTGGTAQVRPVAAPDTESASLTVLEIAA